MHTGNFAISNRKYKESKEGRLLGDIVLNSDSYIPHKYDIDGSEVYGEDGQTIKSIDELAEDEIKKIFGGGE